MKLPPSSSLHRVILAAAALLLAASSGAAAAAICPDLTASDILPADDTASASEFTRINLVVKCPPRDEGAASGASVPAAMNWVVSSGSPAAAAAVAAPSVSMSPPGAFRAEVDDRALNFYVDPSGWPGSGDAG